MAYYECTHKNDQKDPIYIGDKFTVTLKGSHNITTTATVCYIDKTTVCLLGDISLGTANWATQCNYAWNYTVNINSKIYTGTCRIPTLQQMYSKCAGYKRDFHYWTSTRYGGSTSCYVDNRGYVYSNAATSFTYGTAPFIEITL